MRTNLVHSMNIALCVCILHNLATLWGMPDPPEDRVDAGGEGEGDEEIIILEDNLERREIMARADVLRTRLKDNMPPATQVELAKLQRRNNAD